jgi:hypothetical protein
MEALWCSVRWRHLRHPLPVVRFFENGKGFLFRREGPAEGRVTGSEAAIQSTEKPSSSLLNSVSGCECNTGKELTSSIAVDLVLSPSTSTYCKLIPGACWTLKSLL